MTIIRGPLDDNGYTVLPNAALNDRTLSWKARGILVHLLSKPPLWRTSSQRLAKDGPDGRDAVRSGLQELEQAGYLVRTRYQDPSTGRWSVLSTIYDRPVDKSVDKPVDKSSTGAGFSGAGFSGHLESTEQVITDVVVSRLTTSGSCSSCSGAGWIHHAGEVERCPECEATQCV